MSKYEQFVPAECRDFVAACIEQARRNLEKDGFLAPAAMAGKFGGETVIIGGLGNMPKDVAAKLIRKAAREHDADFVLHIDEIWMISADSEAEAEAEALKAQYGEVRLVPNRIDAVMFGLQTHFGYFLGQTPRVTVDEAAKRYTFGAVEFEMMQGGSGRFVGLLPPKGGKQ